MTESDADVFATRSDDGILKYNVRFMNDVMRGKCSWCDWGCEDGGYEHRGLLPPEDVADDTEDMVYYSIQDKKKLRRTRIKSRRVVACDRYTRYELKRTGTCTNCKATPGDHKAKHQHGSVEKSERSTF